MSARKSRGPAVLAETVTEKPNKATGPGTPPGDPNVELRERIRYRAFELYCQRGGGSGNDMNDWLQAEAEVAGKPSAAIDEGELEQIVD